MKRSGRVWLIVSADVQDRCTQRSTDRARFNEGLCPAIRRIKSSSSSATGILSATCLAFVYGHLGDHDLLRVRTDAEKFLLLAALNLVERLADVESTRTS